MNKRVCLLSILMILVLSACNSAQSNFLPVLATPVPSSTATEIATGTPVPTPTQSLPVRDGTLIPTPNTNTALSGSLKFREIVRWGRGRIASAAWSPDGKYLFVSDLTGLYLYDFPGLQLIASRVPYNPVYNAAFSPDGQRLAFIGKDLELWDVETFASIAKQPVPALSLGLTFDPESGNLIGLFRDNERAPLTRMVWDGKLEHNIQSTSFPKLDDLSIVASADLSLAINRLTPSVYYVWDLVNDQEVLSTNFPIGKYKYHWNCGVSNSKGYLLLCDYGNIRMFNLKTKAVSIFYATLGDYRPIKSIGENRYILRNSISNEYALFDLPTGRILFTGKNLQEPIFVDGSQQRFIDGAGKIYDVTAEGKIQVSGKIDAYQKACCTVSSRGSYLAGWNGNRLELRSGVNGELIAQSEVAEANPAELLQFTPAEDKLIRLNSADSAIEIYSLPDLALLASVSLAPIRIDRNLYLYSMPVSPDGSLLALSAFSGNYLFIIDVNQAKIKYQLRGDYMDSIFHPSGILAAHTTNSSRVEVIVKIDPQSGKIIGSLPGHSIVSIALDGKNLVVRTNSGLMVEDWDTGISHLLKEDVSAPILEIVASLAASLNMPSEALVSVAKISLEQNRVYMNEDGGFFRIFELE